MAIYLGLWDRNGRRVVAGSSRDRHHPGWFDVSRFQWGHPESGRNAEIPAAFDGALRNHLTVWLAAAEDTARLCQLMAQNERFELATLHAAPKGRMQSIIDLRHVVLTAGPLPCSTAGAEAVDRTGDGFVLGYANAVIGYKDPGPLSPESPWHERRRLWPSATGSRGRDTGLRASAGASPRAAKPRR